MHIRNGGQLNLKSEKKKLFQLLFSLCAKFCCTQNVKCTHAQISCYKSFLYSDHQPGVPNLTYERTFNATKPDIRLGNMPQR